MRTYYSSGIKQPEVRLLVLLVVILKSTGICAAEATPPDVVMPPSSPHEHHEHHEHHDMTLDSKGMVMNSNSDRLPVECARIRREYQFSVIASVDYARSFPGTVFGMSEHEHRVEPCSRISVTFINKDQIRHQWMVHGLPEYLYPGGMFHLEAAGGHQQTGTFIVPGSDKTYLVHCDVAQHMEKGMKGQLIVGRGNGNLWAIPGVTAGLNSEQYSLTNRVWLPYVFLVLGGLTGAWLLRRSWKRS